VPIIPPGDLVIDADLPGTGQSPKRDVIMRMVNLTGEAGSLNFSRAIEKLDQAVNLGPDCVVGAISCALGGVFAPDEVLLDVRFDGSSPITIVVLDSDGAVVESYTSP
jgi:hypothetical protein